MDPWQGVAIFAAGTAAGGINAAVGSGTLISFPTLIALGYPPVVANISNSLGLVPGSIAGAWAYRGEIRAVGGQLAWLSICSAVGGVLGAIALLELPSAAFDTIVPVLIVLAMLLVVLQPWLARRFGAGRNGSAGPTGEAIRPVGPAVLLGTLAAGVYGGYFGAAQGVLLIGLLGWLLTDSLQHANGIKNYLSAIVNALASVAFVIAAPDRMDWAVAGLIALGSTLGGFFGGALGRRLPAPVLRGFIVVVGTFAVVRLLTG